MKVFPESSFFKKRGALALPTPAEIRAISKYSGNFRAANFNRPPPVLIPSLGLVVKYGAEVTIVEAETLLMIREQLQSQVPVPEVFGWTEDGDQTFIYMSLIEGETLRERWDLMSESERQAVCQELRHMVNAWRALKRDKYDYYIGSLGKKPLNEIFLSGHPELAGPFQGADAVRKFQKLCGINISCEAPIVFTHDDLIPPNIVLSSGPNPKVAAIIDWGQAGWYPAYWEYCKAREITANQEEWFTKYLPLILDPVNEETEYHPFLYFVLSKGI